MSAAILTQFVKYLFVRNELIRKFWKTSPITRRFSPKIIHLESQTFLNFVTPLISYRQFNYWKANY